MLLAHMEEQLKVTACTARREIARKAEVVKAWRNAIFRQQLKSIQDTTAAHIFKQRYLKLGYTALRLVSSFVLQRRRLEALARAHDGERLARKTFTGFQVSKFITLKSQEMSKIARRVYDYNVQKRAHQSLLKYQVLMGHLARLNKCADTYYGQNLLRTGLSMLRIHGEKS